jgi:peptidyl-tRNA hydrolase
MEFQMKLGYNQIEHEVELLARAFIASRKKITQNRIIAGFSVTLEARNQMYYVGCALYMNESGMKVASFLYENQNDVREVEA